MLFEVTFSDGSTRVMQAHNKKQLVAALQNVTFTKAEQKRRCKGSKGCQEIATVSKTFCTPCWEKVLSEFRETYKDELMSEQELKDLAMSFFVNG